MLSILILSVTVEAPSAVVENTKRPGISLVPGVPSTYEVIDAPTTKAVPSSPLKFIAPIASPLETEEKDPIVALLLLLSITDGAGDIPVDSHTKLANPEAVVALA